VATAEDHLHCARVRRLRLLDPFWAAAHDDGHHLEMATEIEIEIDVGVDDEANGGDTSSGTRAAAATTHGAVAPPPRHHAKPPAPLAATPVPPVGRTALVLTPSRPGSRASSRATSRAGSRSQSRNTSVHGGGRFLGGVLHGGSLHAENHVARRLAAMAAAAAAGVGHHGSTPVSPTTTNHNNHNGGDVWPSSSSREGTQYGGAAAFGGNGDEEASSLLLVEEQSYADAEAPGHHQADANGTESQHVPEAGGVTTAPPPYPVEAAGRRV